MDQIVKRVRSNTSCPRTELPKQTLVHDDDLQSRCKHNLLSRTHVRKGRSKNDGHFV